MIKKIKTPLLTMLGLGCCVTVAGGIQSLKLTASAESNAFKVENGASVRLEKEYENFGIRFKANVGEAVDGANYKMLILPEELLSIYEKDTSENKADIVTYMEKLAQKNNGSLAIVDNPTVNEQGEMFGSIVNILWNNINRKFVAVAYYEQNGSYVVADLATDGARSVVDVSEAALGTNDYEGEANVKDKGYLVEKIRMGEKQKAGYAKEDVYINEDFRYATDPSLVQFSFNAKGTESTAKLVSSAADYALQYYNAGDNSALELAFGNVKEGNYKLSFKMTENAVATYNYVDWTILAGATEEKSLFGECYANDNSFEYYFEQSEAGDLLATIKGAKTGQILIDDLCLEKVDEIPAESTTFTVFNGANFDNMLSPYLPLSAYGIYTKDSGMSLSVNVGEDKKTTSLKATGVGSIDFYLGELPQGSYLLKMKAEISEAFTADLKYTRAVTLNAGGAYASSLAYAGVTVKFDLGYSFSKAAVNEDGTYEFLLTTIGTDPACMVHIDNTEANGSMTLDDVSFAKVDYTKGYTFDFADEITTRPNNGNDNLGSGTGSALLNVIAPKVAWNSSTLTPQKITEDGKNYLSITNTQGYSTWARVWIGTLDAGTYTIEFAGEFSDNLGFLCNCGSKSGWGPYEKTELAQEDGTYKITVTLSAVKDVYIGVREKNNGADGFSAKYSYIKVTKTA